MRTISGRAARLTLTSQWLPCALTAKVTGLFEDLPQSAHFAGLFEKKPNGFQKVLPGLVFSAPAGGDVKLPTVSNVLLSLFEGLRCEFNIHNYCQTNSLLYTQLCHSEAGTRTTGAVFVRTRANKAKVLKETILRQIWPHLRYHGSKSGGLYGTPSIPSLLLW